MKYENKEAFEQVNMFGTGTPNTAYAKFFIGDSFLNPLTDPKGSLFAANVTFEPACRNNWHIHHATSGGGQLLLCTAGEGWYQEEGKDAVSLHEGSVIMIPANVKHWHGAKKDSWFIDDDQAAEAVRTAVKLGYRLIDTAQAYGNERGVGEGVRTCGVPREELFVASKVAAELKTYDEAKKSIDETLEKTGLDYLDQMIIHSPQPWNQFRVEKRYFEENKAVWRALEDAQSEGKVRVIGVSNFLRDDLENLLSDCRVKPMVNQILLHISNTDLALLDYCHEQGIQVEAYSPIAHGEALKNPAIAEMAKKYGINAAQLCIRYVIELGAVALPKTANPDHMASNAAVDFTILSEDMETLKHTDRIADYGEFNIFPVFSGKPLA